MVTKLTRISLLVLGLATPLACTHGGEPEAQPAQPAAAAAEKPAEKAPAEKPAEKPAGPSDAQIAGIVVAANQVDVDAGKLAEKKAHAKSVKAFAKQMVKDHTAVNKQAADLVKKLGVTPEDSDTAKSLKDGGKANVDALKKLKGKAFDKAYVDHEVEYHQAVLDALDKVLIPSAKNAELKALLEKSRPAFEAHLEHAKKVQAELAAAKK